MRRIWCFAELGAAAAYLGRRGASERGGWLQRSADWLVSSEQRAAIDIAGCGAGRKNTASRSHSFELVRVWEPWCANVVEPSCRARASSYEGSAFDPRARGAVFGVMLGLCPASSKVFVSAVKRPHTHAYQIVVLSTRSMMILF